MDIQGISASQILTVGIFLVGLICIQIFIKRIKINSPLSGEVIKESNLLKKNL